MANPIPSNLKSEAKKAAKILREFTEISNRNGPDKLIPPHVIAKAEGLAIISVIKAGFMITARGGSGIVIARLADRRWSAPSAIGIAGLGGGFEIGVEVSDLVIILNQRSAVEAFSKGGNLTLGGNCTVAVGPMGRNVEADVALRSPAAVFTYCRSRGLFAGISLEGSGLIERKETNRKFYGREIRASAILNGDVEPPSECYDLYHILEVYAEAYTADWISKNPSARASTAPSRPAPPGKRPTNNYQPPQPTNNYQPPPSTNYQPPPSTNYQPPPSTNYQPPPSTNYQPPPSTNYQPPPSTNYQPPPPTKYQPSPPPVHYQQNRPPPAPPTGSKNTLYPSISVYKSDTSSRHTPNNYGGAAASGAQAWGDGGSSAPIVVTATHPFTGQQPGDLSFAPGEHITVITKTDSQYDWWEGQTADGRTGIFPANFVTY
ncbi:SH3 domain-containing YSC84-like protein 1 isoform X2 [Periophthalmus magnuspinnatus]|uniref:SH3 domain-containing YSC84-like protein 1 isoform X2 n=1 Tax=Periophthalmus magnuspinnatus TaxID=409849 RepID=UPI00145A28CA|nr:SH3 domain-containing YSC84-like protein 1 isoform X2 [Periophthalmus magnuspinnatus]